MKVLYLDDDEDRIFYAEARQYRRDRILSVRTADMAIKKLEEEEWDLVELDYDLPLSHGADYVDEYHNGGNVAYFIAEMDNPPRVILHTHSHSGGRLMYDVLTAAGVDVQFLPFRWQDDRGFAKHILKNAFHDKIPPRLPDP